MDQMNGQYLLDIAESAKRVLNEMVSPHCGPNDTNVFISSVGVTSGTNFSITCSSHLLTVKPTSDNWSLKILLIIQRPSLFF